MKKSLSWNFSHIDRDWTQGRIHLPGKFGEKIPALGTATKIPFNLGFCGGA